MTNCIRNEEIFSTSGAIKMHSKLRFIETHHSFGLFLIGSLWLCFVRVRSIRSRLVKRDHPQNYLKLHTATPQRMKRIIMYFHFELLFIWPRMARASLHEYYVEKPWQCTIMTLYACDENRLYCALFTNNDLLEETAFTSLTVLNVHGATCEPFVLVRSSHINMQIYQ